MAILNPPAEAFSEREAGGANVSAAEEVLNSEWSGTQPIPSVS